MAFVVYPAAVSPQAEGAWRAVFPDFAELECTASSQAELIGAAREALTTTLQRLEQRGDVWPAPTALSEVAVPPGGSVILVDVSVDDTPVRVTISLGERLLKRIDQDAEARSMTRSGYLALGARRLLDASEPFGSATGSRLEAEIAAMGKRVNEALGPDSPVGRTLAELDSMALDGLRRLGEEVRSAMRRRAPPHPAPDADPPESDRQA